LKRERGGLRGWEPSNPINAKGSQFGTQNRNPALTGSISVRPVQIHLKTAAGAWLKRERGGLRGWGPSNPINAWRAGLVHEPNPGPCKLNISRACADLPEYSFGWLVEGLEREVQGLEGLKYSIQEGWAINYYKLVNKSNMKRLIADAPYFVLNTSK
jgi:hypothetical protein